jgi:hypothetical protein
MKEKLRRSFDAEMTAAMHCHAKGELANAIRHLERAHVLGQRHVLPHVRTHYWMLRLGCERASGAGVLVEAWGQFWRIVLGAVGSALGIVPSGNTGATNVGMFKKLPIDPELARILE